jgi:hypothetical protein
MSTGIPLGMRKVSLFVIIVVGSFLIATTGVGVWETARTVAMRRYRASRKSESDSGAEGKKKRKIGIENATPVAGPRHDLKSNIRVCKRHRDVADSKNIIRGIC